MNKILKRKFYQRNTLEVAQDLLGCFLVRKIGNTEIRALITETEAYIGTDDLASHASKGRTPRTQLMFGQAGFVYVYMIYGMYYCMNIVTEKKDFPAAVLIRAVQIDGIPYQKTNGPGKLCNTLKIDTTLKGQDITVGENLWVEKKNLKLSQKIIASKRIGIDYAEHCREYLWRFTLEEFSGKK